MTTRHREHDTVEAIQALQNDYPFATGLLIYCLIERMLKYFIIDEIYKPEPELKGKFCKKLKGLDANELQKKLISYTIKVIAGNFNKKCYQIIFKDIEKRRNDYMHSNDLLPPDVKTEKEKRSREHKTDLQRAIDDLKITLKILEDGYEIIIDCDKKIGDFRQR